MELKISTNMSGKMSGINCLSTSALQNETCKARRAMDGTICTKCYACSCAKRYSRLAENLIHNSEILSSRILDDSELPIVNQTIFRFEAFGDLINQIHAENFVRIVNKNPQTRFALYTKNIGFLEPVLDRMHKPENLIVVQSSLFINKIDEKISQYADHVFTVYSKDFIAKHGIVINCGAKHCLSCQICYHRNGIYHISEQLK